MKGDLLYSGGILRLGGVSLLELAEEYGTPLYVYDMARLDSNIRDYSEAFRGLDVKICYAAKANSNGYILRRVASGGLGADVVSANEMRLAMRAGIKASDIVFAGVSKTLEEISFAVEQGVYSINLESAQELERVEKTAASLGREANVSIRINPDVDPRTHPKISTGVKTSKFGVFPEEARKLYRRISSSDKLNARGVHLHIGSQITTLPPIELAMKAAVEFADSLRAEGIELEAVDIGGGLGISYESPRQIHPGDIGGLAKRYLAGKNYRLLIEPGRSIIGDAALLLCRIEYLKKGPEKNFVMTDAGMNDLVRPAMYDSYHGIMPVSEEGEELVADVAGPICETGDLLAKDRPLKGLSQGACLAVLDAGAYGYSMASNYNSRLRPAEVAVEDGGHRLIRKRESFEDLYRTETE